MGVTVRAVAPPPRPGAPAGPPPRRGRGALPGAMAWDRSGARRAGGCVAAPQVRRDDPVGGLGAAGVGRRSPGGTPRSRSRGRAPPSPGRRPRTAPPGRSRCAGGRGESQTGPPAEFKDSTGVTAWPTRRRARHCRFTVGSIRPGSPAPRRPHPPAAQAEGRHNQTVPSPRSPIRVPHGRSRRTLGAPLAPRSHHGCVHRLLRRPAAGRREPRRLHQGPARSAAGRRRAGHHRPGRACWPARVGSGKPSGPSMPSRIRRREGSMGASTTP